MTTLIKYTQKLTSKNKNIVIFVSTLSQLKNIDFLINLDFYIKNKNFINDLNNNIFTSLSNIGLKNNLLANIHICLVGKNISNKNLKLGSSLYQYFKSINDKNILFFFSKIISSKFKNEVSDIIFGYMVKSYNFDKYKSKKSKSLNHNNFLYLYNIKEFKELKYKINLLESLNFTKDLVSEPANILNPILFANRCKDLKKYNLKIKILDKKRLVKIGMKSLLSVSKGSENEPRVVILEWNIKPNSKPTILVGKGVTFDSGGVSLKPATGMEEMITDMAGSAVVVGSMINAALNRSSKSIVGIVGLVENMPDGKSQRPGDIIQSLSGKTIEVLNTDAEGRLVLADILTYVQSRYDVKEIIDFATLTGAIMIALGTHKAGLFSNNDKLSKKLELAGNVSGECVWPMPLGKEYDDEINSFRADIKNIGSSKYGGSIHAAQFIKRFINEGIPWAHLDIAGVSWTLKSGNNSFPQLHSPGATAFGVRLIDQFMKGK